MPGQSVLENRLEAVVRRRLAKTEAERRNTLRMARTGEPLRSEGNDQRRRAAETREEADMGRRWESRTGAEATKGPRRNFIPVAFLEKGAAAARSVALVSMFGGIRTGTGFLVSPDLFITNFHVVPDTDFAANAEILFDYESDALGSLRQASVFRLDPGRCFVCDDVDGLDYAVIGLGAQVSGPQGAARFGFNALSGSGSKHALGEFANIVQHPDGRHKEVVLQDNLIAGRHEKALHYVADTEPGSSGSPVFNNDWQVIALHHWGSVSDPGAADGKYEPDAVNEGIRISRIVADLHERIQGLATAWRERVGRALDLGNAAGPLEISRRSAAPEQQAGPSWRSNEDGSVTWRVPVEITIGIPGLAPPAPAPAPPDPAAPATPANPGADSAALPYGPEARSLEQLLSATGYDPGFIEGFDIPLPALKGAAAAQAVELEPRYRTRGRKPYELTYTHFAVVMHRERKMAMLTAVNIDGTRLFGLERGSGEQYLYTSASSALTARLAEAAEASSWFFDGRLPKELQTGRQFYDRADNNSLVEPKDAGFVDHVDFQRGHIVRRLDPVWGTREEALAADADSHAWTNVAPQTEEFNAGNRDPATVAAGEEKRLWSAAENAILRNAFADRARLSVFGGPVFGDRDPVYAGTDDLGYRRRVPLEFWKLVCWKGESGLRSLALLISQEDILLKRPRRGRRGEAEALDSAGELLALRDFVTTVARLEEKISMKFHARVRGGDVWARNEDRIADSMTSEEFLAVLRS